MPLEVLSRATHQLKQSYGVLGRKITYDRITPEYTALQTPHTHQSSSSQAARH